MEEYSRYEEFVGIVNFDYVKNFIKGILKTGTGTNGIHNYHVPDKDRQVLFFRFLRPGQSVKITHCKERNVLKVIGLRENEFAELEELYNTVSKTQKTAQAVNKGDYLSSLFF